MRYYSRKVLWNNVKPSVESTKMPHSPVPSPERTLQLIDESESDEERPVSAGSQGKNTDSQKKVVSKQQSGLEERRATQESEASQLKTKDPAVRWTNTHEINVHWFSHIGKDFPIDRVAWDTKLEFGQTRPLDDAYVQRLMNSFRSRPSGSP